MGKKYLDTKGGTLESSILDVWKQAAIVTETNKNDKSDDGEGLDAVQPKAVKKKFDDRKDKDIDNDGDIDDSDEYLHKKRKAVSKAISKKVDEDVDLDKNAAEFTQNAYFKVQSMRDALRKVWGEAHVPDHDEDEDDEKVKGPKAKTDTGKKAAKVDIKPEITEKKKKGIKSGYGSY